MTEMQDSNILFFQHFSRPYAFHQSSGFCQAGRRLEGGGSLSTSAFPSSVGFCSRSRRFSKSAVTPNPTRQKTRRATRVQTVASAAGVGSVSAPKPRPRIARMAGPEITDGMAAGWWLIAAGGWNAGRRVARAIWWRKRGASGSCASAGNRCAGKSAGFPH